MYKLMFQNSKAALAFAAMTVIGAVSMVGTPEDSGVVTRAADMIASQRQSIARDAAAFAEGQSGGDAPSQARPPSVFGDYTPADEAAAQQATVAPKGGASATSNPLTAPLAPGARVYQSGDYSPSPVITERTMEIEPQ